MFFTYLRRELFNRKRQTAIVSLGLALAIAVVLVVSSLANGAKNAQSQVLDSLYGIGTDITVTQAPTPPQQGQGGARQQFDVPGGQSGAAADGQQRQVNRTNLRTAPGSGTLDEAAVATVRNVPDVAAVSTALKLENTSFSGELPQIDQGQAVPNGQGRPGQGATQTPSLGSSSFSVTSFSVLGVEPMATTGPLSSTNLNSGRALDSSDAGQFNAVIDSTYATSESLTVGSTLTLGKTDGTQEFTIVGIVSSATAAAETAANVYIPLDIAQTLSGRTGLVSTIYVTSSTGSSTTSVTDEIRAALPNATVSTTSDLGSTVSGSLSDASDLLGNLGKWLSVVVLALAFLIAVLFTMSGVGRRTREFGTLRALGWRKNRIVRQVASESLVQGIFGGGIGLLLGFVVVKVIDSFAPSLQATTGGLQGTFGGFGGAGGPGGNGQAQGAGRTGSTIAGAAQGGPRVPGRTATTYQVVLKAAMTPGIIAIAIGLAILGGVIAGVFGGLRASRLRPADALRSVA
ncbi:MAG: ABC transporter permease [Actinomycetes bacterium]